MTRTDRKNGSASGTLIGRDETKFDDLGRPYETAKYAVNISTGQVGNALVGKVWYDPAGNVLKEKPAGAEQFTKYQRDGQGNTSPEIS